MGVKSFDDTWWGMRMPFSINRFPTPTPVPSEDLVKFNPIYIQPPPYPMIKCCPSIPPPNKILVLATMSSSSLKSVDKFVTYRCSETYVCWCRCRLVELLRKIERELVGEITAGYVRWGFCCPRHDWCRTGYRDLLRIVSWIEEDRGV